MQFDPFIIPFNIGLYFILIYAVARSIIMVQGLFRVLTSSGLQRGFFGRAFGQSLKEIFLESLIHRKILKSNFRLGYMHMSLAFGWFLLILFGTIEADVFGESHLNPPYKAIFFKFFNPVHGRMGIEAAYTFLMDLILAFILSGLILAVIKRFYSPVVGMRRTTKLKPLDKVALTSLMADFPKPPSGRELYKRSIRNRKLPDRNHWFMPWHHFSLQLKWLTLSGGSIHCHLVLFSYFFLLQDTCISRRNSS